MMTQEIYDKMVARAKERDQDLMNAIREALIHKAQDDNDDEEVT